MPNGDPNTLIYWLTETLRLARENGTPEGLKIPRRRISELIDKDVSTINDFETGRGGWPRDPEERVGAYAELTGIPPQELWRTAVADWIKATTPKKRRR